MDNKKLISRNVEVRENSVVITEQLQSEMDLLQLQQLLQQIKMRKTGLKEQNQRLIEEYNAMVQQETEIEDLISQLNSEDIEVIE